MDRKYIAGMSMKGGRNNDFFFCLLDYYCAENKLFLKSFLQMKDENEKNVDDAVKGWVDTYDLSDLIIDCPLSNPPCETCALVCPGLDLCPQIAVEEVRKKIKGLLDADQLAISDNPKKYEQERNLDDEIFYGKDIFARGSSEPILSRPFKRRLKKDFLPYWNRPLDFWVWCHYYNQLLELFKISYDSFGSTSLMLLKRFEYLKRHLPVTLTLYEANVPIVLVELLRSKIITKYDLLDLNHLDLSGQARLNIIKKLETKLNLFIYDQEFELMIENPRAFHSFLLALAGWRFYLGKFHQMPVWTEPDLTNFILPVFL